MKHNHALTLSLPHPLYLIAFLFTLWHCPVAGQLRQNIDCNCNLTGDYEAMRKGVAPYQNYGNSAESGPIYKVEYNGVYLSIIKNESGVEVYGLGPVPPSQPLTPLGFSPDQHRFLYFQVYANKYYYYLVDLLANRVIYSFETTSNNLTTQFSASGRYFFCIEVVNNTGSDLVNLHFVDVGTPEAYTESFEIASSAAPGGIAAWGFNQNKNKAPTEAGFFYAWKNPQDNIEYRLLGLGQYPIKTSGKFPIAGNAEYRFSPCGDVLGVSDLNGAALFSTLTAGRMAEIEMNYVNSFRCTADNHQIGNEILAANTADSHCNSGSTDSDAPVWPPNSSLILSDVSYTSMQLRWSAANDNTAVTEYRIFVDDKQTGAVAGNIREYYLQGLIPSKRYEIKVEAADAAGNQSQNGPRISASTHSDASDHYPPVWPGESLKLTVSSESSATLTWPTAFDSVQVTSYKVFLNGSLTITVTGNVRTAEITGLEKGKTYLLGVQAGDDAGNWSTMLTTSMFFSDQVLSIMPDSILSKGINFGVMAPGAVKYAYFTIANNGLLGQSLALNSNNNKFKISPASLSLAPGETGYVSVTFTAGSTDSQESGKFTVRTGTTTLMTFDLKAVVNATRILKVSETNLSFGSVEAGTECYRILQLSNEGNSPLSIQSMRSSDASFKILYSGGFPVIISPGQSHHIDIVFNPVSTGLKNGFLYIESDADNDVAPLHLTGIGVAPHSTWYSDKIYTGAIAPVIAVDRAGANHVLATAKDRGDLIYLTDVSGNWQNAVIANDVLSGSPAITCDAQGRLHICYATAVDSSVYYRVKEQGDWSPPEKIAKDAMWASAIAVDASGTVHIGYMNVDAMAAPGTVKYAKKAGGNWTVDSVTGAYDFASMAVNRNGVPYFAMYPYIRYTSQLQGGQWKPINYIPSPWGSGQMEGMIIRMDIDQDQLPVITALTKKFMTTFRQDQNGHWTSTMITRIGFLTYGFDTEIDAENNLHCTYYLSKGQYPDQEIDLFYWHSGSECSVLLDVGRIWGYPLNSIAIDSSGFLHIAFGTAVEEPYSNNISYITNDPSPGSRSISVYSGTENFGEVQKGDTLTAYFVIRNLGKTELEIYGIASSDSIFHTSVSSATIPAKDSLVVRVAMIPPHNIEAGKRHSNIVIRHNDSRKPDQVVAFEGTVIENPVIAVDRDRISFGKMDPGERDSAVLKISNKGKHTLEIREISSSNSLFTISSGPDTIAPGDSAYVTICCGIPDPAEGGLQEGVITISSNDLGTPRLQINAGVYVVKGPSIYVGIHELIFDTVAIGIPSVRQFYIENRGGDALDIDSIKNGNLVFNIMPRSARVEAGDSLAVSVQCLTDPNTPAGVLMDTIMIVHNDSSRPALKVFLVAHVVAERPVIEVSPLKINFGSVSIFSSAVREVIVTNNSERDIAIDQVRIDQQDNSFSIVPPLFSKKLILRSHQSYKMKIKFKPRKFKVYKGTLVIETGNLARNLKVELTGRGTVWGSR